LARSGRALEAEQRIDALNMAIQRDAPRLSEYLKIYLHSVAAATACERGRFHDALRDVDAVIAYHQSKSPQSSVVATRLRIRADALLGLGHVEEAAQAAQDAAARWHRFTSGIDHASARNIDTLLMARIQLMRGLAMEAIGTLERLAAPPDANDLPLAIDELRGDVVRSQAWLLAKRPDRAMALAQGVRDRLDPSPLRPYLVALEADASLALGQAQASVRHPGACENLSHAQRLRSVHDHPGSPRLVTIRRALAATCERGRGAP